MKTFGQFVGTEEMPVIDELDEAVDIPSNQLSHDFKKHLGAIGYTLSNVSSVMKGPSGAIVSIKGEGRLVKSVLAILVKHPYFRWLETSRKDGMTIGYTNSILSPENRE